MLKKLLVGLAGLAGVLSATASIEMGQNYLAFNSTDTTSKAAETLKTNIYVLANIWDMQGIMNLTVDWYRVGSCSTGFKVGVYEGNNESDWDLNTVLITKRGAASGDTTASINLAGTTYVQFWYLADDSADSLRFSNTIPLSVR